MGKKIYIFLFTYMSFFITDYWSLIIFHIVTPGSKMFLPCLFSSQNESGSWIMKVKYK